MNDEYKDEWTGSVYLTHRHRRRGSLLRRIVMRYAWVLANFGDPEDKGTALTKRGATRSLLKAHANVLRPPHAVFDIELPEVLDE